MILNQKDLAECPNAPGGLNKVQQCYTPRRCYKIPILMRDDLINTSSKKGVSSQKRSDNSARR